MPVETLTVFMSYPPEIEEQRSLLIKRIAEEQAACKERCQPYIDALVRLNIYGRPTYVLTPNPDPRGAINADPP